MYNKKIFLDINKQIEILKNKNLSFRDEEKAKFLLIKNNYYSVINGYRDPFVLNTNSKKSKYIDGTYFEEIFSLYSFEMDLKTTLLKYIFIIEKNIKSAISYEFSKIYGHENYLNVENFDNSKDADVRGMFYLFSNLYSVISRSINKNDYMKYYVDNYNNVPLWVLANAMSLGNIINFFRLMKKSEKEYISKYYFKSNSEDLEAYLENINVFRNICAHDERLYKYEASGKSIPINNIHTFLQIKDNKGRNDVFSLVIGLCYLLDKENALKFIYDLIPIFDKFEKQLTSINISKILDIMGFPNNWKDIETILK